MKSKLQVTVAKAILEGISVSDLVKDTRGYGLLNYTRSGITTTYSKVKSKLKTVGLVD